MKKYFKLVIAIIFLLKINKIYSQENLYTSVNQQKYYIEIEQKYSWFDALAKCASLDMALVTIETKNKSEDINRLVINTFGKKFPLWVGGVINGDNPRQFVWVSTGKKFTFNFWASGQPDFAGNNEYCAQIGWGNNMEWNDHVCNYHFGYICEFSPYHQLKAEMKKQQQLEQELKMEQKMQQIVQDQLKQQKSDDNSKYRDIIFHLVQNP